MQDRASAHCHERVLQSRVPGGRMSILVAGATGFVGQHIALALQRKAGHVRGLVRSGASNPKAKNLASAGVEVVAGDLTIPDTVAP